MKLGIFTSQLCSNGKEMYKKRDPARANLLFRLINLCCFDVLVAVAVVAKTPLFFIGTTTQREMRTRKSAEETEHDFRCSTFRSATGLPWAPETFHARFPVSALFKSSSSTREKTSHGTQGMVKSD